MSPTIPAIGAPIVMADTAATRSLFVFIDEYPSGFTLCWCACTGVGAHNARTEVFKSRDRSHDLLRADNGTRVVRDVDVESGVHLLLRVTRGRVFDHRDLVAQLSREAHRCLHTGVRYESNDDELMDAVILELQIQI